MIRIFKEEVAAQVSSEMRFALDKEMRARIITAVRVIITRRSALVAHAQNIICYMFAKSVVEGEIFALEAGQDAPFFNYSRIRNNASFELVQVGKAIVT